MGINERVFNFSAGPSMLPLEVLEEAAAQMTSYNGLGESVMEMSHRSKEFDEIIKTAEANLRELMNIPDNYKGNVSTRGRYSTIFYGSFKSFKEFKKSGLCNNRFLG